MSSWGNFDFWVLAVLWRMRRTVGLMLSCSLTSGLSYAVRSLFGAAFPLPAFEVPPCVMSAASLIAGTLLACADESLVPPAPSKSVCAEFLLGG
jgi:hypothetical protein